MKTNFLNILRMNRKVLTIICLKHILDFQYLLFWQKHYLKQKVKIKTVIKSRLRDLEDEIKKMFKDEKKMKNQIKY